VVALFYRLEKGGSNGILGNIDCPSPQSIANLGADRAEQAPPYKTRNFDTNFWYETLERVAGRARAEEKVLDSR
jgi:hypothetical protein